MLLAVSVSKLLQRSQTRRSKVMYRSGTGLRGNHFWHFGKGKRKIKKLSRCWGRELQETIPTVWDGNRKFASALKPHFFLEKCSYLHKLSIFAMKIWKYINGIKLFIPGWEREQSNKLCSPYTGREHVLP